MLTSIRSLLSFRLLAFVLLCALPLAGCGTNLGPPSGFVTRAVTFNIQWGKTSSTDNTDDDPSIIKAPASAKSAILTLQKAQANGDDLIYQAARPTGVAPVKQSYNPPAQAKVGATILVVEFYLNANANPNAGDTPIGSLTTTQVVQDKPNNKITIDTTIPPDQVVVMPGQTVPVGGSLRLKYTALDKNGTAVPVITTGPNGAIIQLASQPSLVTVSNDLAGYAQVTGQFQGDQAVTVTVTTPSSDPTKPSTQTTSKPAVVRVTPQVSVVVTPSAVTLSAQQTQHFDARVSHADGSSVINSAVKWNVQEGSAGGVIDPDRGNYTAPNTGGVYHVIATSQEDTRQTATATVAVNAALTVTIDPIPAVNENGVIQLTAHVTGAAKGGVNWSVQEGSIGGTIDPNGTIDANGTCHTTYQAPLRTGTFHIIANSLQNSNKTDSQPVTVLTGSGSITVE